MPTSPLIVYLATCSVNGKRYVGQTVQSLPTRITGHRNDAKSRRYKNQPFIAAIRKHGIDTFHFEEIDRADSQEELDYMERYWIAFHRLTDRRYGYNVQVGGQGTHWSPEGMRKGIRCIETNETYPSMAQAARVRGISPASLTLHMRGDHKTCDGCHWEWTGNAGAAIYETSEGVKSTFRGNKKRQQEANHGPRAAVKCVETGEIFPSLTAAGARYGVDKRAIYSAVERGIVAATYHWVRLGPKRKHNARGTRTTPVKCVETGVVYPSLTAAAKALGLRTASSVWCAIHRNELAGGYHWAYV